MVIHYFLMHLKKTYATILQPEIVTAPFCFLERKNYSQLLDDYSATIYKHFCLWDSRKKIEGRWSKNGIIRPSPSSLPKEGLPEAVFLQQGLAKRTFVLETPSEYDLRLRIKAQVAMIQKATSKFSVLATKE